LVDRCTQTLMPSRAHLGESYIYLWGFFNWIDQTVFFYPHPF
jgi:hypothetical protein